MYILFQVMPNCQKFMTDFRFDHIRYSDFWGSVLIIDSSGDIS